MDIAIEIAELRKKLERLKKENNRLFASLIELQINRQIISDNLEEVMIKNQKLAAYGSFLSGNFK